MVLRGQGKSRPRAFTSPSAGRHTSSADEGERSKAASMCKRRWCCSNSLRSRDAEASSFRKQGTVIRKPWTDTQEMAAKYSGADLFKNG